MKNLKLELIKELRPELYKLQDVRYEVQVFSGLQDYNHNDFRFKEVFQGANLIEARRAAIEFTVSYEREARIRDMHYEEYWDDTKLRCEDLLYLSWVHFFSNKEDEVGIPIGREYYDGLCENLQKEAMYYLNHNLIKTDELETIYVRKNCPFIPRYFLYGSQINRLKMGNECFEYTVLKENLAEILKMNIE